MKARASRNQDALKNLVGSKDRPHPGLLPQEKENRFQSLAGTMRWISRAVFRKPKRIDHFHSRLGFARRGPAFLAPVDGFLLRCKAFRADAMGRRCVKSLPQKLLHRHVVTAGHLVIARRQHEILLAKRQKLGPGETADGEPAGAATIPSRD